MRAARAMSAVTISRRRSTRSTITPAPAPSSSQGRPCTAVTAATAPGERVSWAASRGKAASRTPFPKSERNSDSQYRANGARSRPASATTPPSCPAVPRSAAGDVEEGPGGFPQGADGDAELPGPRVDRRPEPEGAAALEGVDGYAAPAEAAFVLRAGVVGGRDAEARRDHRPPIADAPGVPVELDGHEVLARRDVLDRHGGPLEREADAQARDRAWFLAGPAVHLGQLAGVRGRLPAVPQLGGQDREHRAVRRQRADGEQRIGDGGHDRGRVEMHDPGLGGAEGPVGGGRQELGQVAFGRVRPGGPREAGGHRGGRRDDEPNGWA